MGHKGVSKRKPKKSESLPHNGAASSAQTHGNDNSPVQSLVKTNDNTPNRSGTNPSMGSSKKNRKGK